MPGNPQARAHTANSERPSAPRQPASFGRRRPSRAELGVAAGGIARESPKPRQHPPGKVVKVGAQYWGRVGIPVGSQGPLRAAGGCYSGGSQEGDQRPQRLGERWGRVEPAEAQTRTFESLPVDLELKKSHKTLFDTEVMERVADVPPHEVLAGLQLW